MATLTCRRDGCSDPIASPKAGLCREHRNSYMREWYKTEKGRERVHRGTLAKHGLTPESFDALWDAQGGRCANPRCPVVGEHGANRRSEQGLCVDHDHETGEVRGLLCNGCNLALGHARDDQDILLGLVEYLQTRKVL